MLYLLEPPATLKWVDFPASLARRAVEEHGADLGKLDWRSDTPRLVTDDTIRVALINGIKCSRGLAIEAIDLIDLDRAQELRRLSRELEEGNSAGHDQFMEQLIPGWIESGKRLQAEVDELTEQSIRNAEDEAQVLLEGPKDEDLIAHWTSLGGHLP